ncbi:MAG: RNA-guided endonuclease TnpB family protein [Candidatus Methanomethylicia archaeon]|nr:RNA-guided endonuclease TnpB family protein [Candidatus Methanomethylicia archaeon]
MSYSVRGEEPVVIEALKMRALPEGSYDYLLEFLRLYRDAVQMVANKIWSINKKLSRRKLHRLFYSDLVRLGFRAHHAKEIYIYAKSIVESVRSNNGEKPVLRRLTARIDKYDYKLDLDNMTLMLKLHNDYEAKLRLVAPRESVEMFKGWSNYGLVVKYEDGKFWASIYFKRAVKLLKPRTTMAIDLNFDNITLATFTFNGRLLKLKRFKTQLRKLLTHRIWIERIQKRYPRSWRFIKGVKRAIKKHGKRIERISWDYAHKVGDLIAELALKHHSVIILENLDGLRENSKKGRRFNKKLGLWFYRRVLFCIEYEARERNLEVVKVNPKSTSSKCPRCGGKLVKYGHRVLRCGECGFIGDRDVAATLNICKKYVSKCSRCGVLGVALNAPEPDENPSGVRGNKGDAMKNTSSYMNLCES